MSCKSLVLVVLFALLVVSNASDVIAEQPALQVLIIDGQNNHQWKVTTPILKEFLEESGLFSVEVATTPPAKHDMSMFRPDFGKYDVVVSNYNGEPWPEGTQQEFQAFVHAGGGFVTVHAADNAFPNWPEYNEIIGLGGWNNRSEKSGPYLYFKEDRLIRDESKGRGGHHGKQHKFVVDLRDAEHPITKGLPSSWLHTQDELYEQLRGPAKNISVLATAYADPKQGGSGRDEPMLMTIQYGQGRVFHTTLGHADYSMRCVGFKTTLLRGTEWAATGKVTQDIPDNFPTAEQDIPTETP